MRQYTVPKSIPYATRYNTRNAAKCYKNASKFFPDVTNKESIIRKYNIITKKLLAPRLLHLIDSILTLLIIDYFTT